MKYTDEMLNEAYKNVSIVTKQDARVSLGYTNLDGNMKVFLKEFLDQLDIATKDQYNEHLHVMLYDMKDKAADIVDSCRELISIVEDLRDEQN